jgi:hypothetical protein
VWSVARVVLKTGKCALKNGVKRTKDDVIRQDGPGSLGWSSSRRGLAGTERPVS